MLKTAASLLSGLLIAAGAFFMLRRSGGMLANLFFRPYIESGAAVSNTAEQLNMLSRSKSELAHDLAECKIKLAKLEAIKVLSKNLQEENRQLRLLNRLPRPAGWRLFPCEISLRDPLYWKQSFTILLNTADSVMIPEGASVLTVMADGTPVLVGRIKEINGECASVETVFSPDLRLTAVLEKSGCTGIINTGTTHSSHSMISIGFLPIGVKYSQEDTIRTTGFEKYIPGGLVIGFLNQVEELDARFTSELHCSGTMHPAADMDKLRFVYVAAPAGR